MSKNCVIMQRMKNNYEHRSRTYLTRRTPVIIRLDGKAFHTYTKKLNKPFDEALMEDMKNTAIYLCQKIQGAKCAYVQSDEISILITDYDKLSTDAWFDYNIQKITSISASLATAKFNQLRFIRNKDYNNELTRKAFNSKLGDKGYDVDYVEKQTSIEETELALFDSRAFNIPQEEVSNYFLARQLDATKNSISMLAQSLYSHKELHKKNSSEMQEMCFQKGHNWNNLNFSKKRGSFIVKETYWNDLPLIYNGDKFKGTKELHCTNVTLPENERFYYVPRAKNSQGEIIDGSRYAVSEKPYKIRSKWEMIKTPLKFTEDIFKKYI